MAEYYCPKCGIDSMEPVYKNIKSEEIIEFYCSYCGYVKKA